MKFYSHLKEKPVSEGYIVPHHQNPYRAYTFIFVSPYWHQWVRGPSFWLHRPHSNTSPQLSTLLSRPPYQKEWLHSIWDQYSVIAFPRTLPDHSKECKSTCNWPQILRKCRILLLFSFHQHHKMQLPGKTEAEHFNSILCYQPAFHLSCL